MKLERSQEPFQDQEHFKNPGKLSESLETFGEPGTDQSFRNLYILVMYSGNEKHFQDLRNFLRIQEPS